MEPFLFLPAIFMVNKTDTSPKARAISCVPSMPQDKIMASIAPTHVPLVTPRISGVASGLENSDWNVLPAHVRPAPTIIAIKIRGKRKFTIIE